MDKYRCRNMLLKKASLLKDLREGRNVSLNSVSSEALTCLIYILHFIVSGEIPISQTTHQSLKNANLIQKLSKIRTKKSLLSIIKRDQAILFLTPFEKLWPDLLQNVIVKK